jgi:hypothetical protein
MGMMGGVLGTMISAVAVVLITWRDQMIRTRANVEKIINVPSIIEMPGIPSSGGLNPMLLRSAIGLDTRRK